MKNMNKKRFISLGYLFNIINSVRFSGDCALVELGDGTDHEQRIRASAGFIGGVHRKLSETDVDGIQRNVGVGDGAERGAAAHVAAVGEELNRNVRALADFTEHSGGNRVGGVLLTRWT